MARGVQSFVATGSEFACVFMYRKDAQHLVISRLVAHICRKKRPKLVKVDAASSPGFNACLLDVLADNAAMLLSAV